MRTYYTARQAREESLSLNDEKTQELMNDIFESIDFAVKNARFQVVYNSVIPEKVQNILKEMGYSVKNETNQFDGTSYVISW